MKFKSAGLLLCIILTVALIIYATAKAEKQNRVEKTKVACTGSGSLKTIEYDGHKWVLYSSYRSAGLVHHPDCPCNK